MRQVLFVQGGGDGVHDQWDNHLVDSLRSELGPAYEIRYPVMPNEADPEYAVWELALQKELASLEPGAIVAGHSVGGTILIHVLAEQYATSQVRRRLPHRSAVHRHRRMDKRRHRATIGLVRSATTRRSHPLLSWSR